MTGSVALAWNDITVEFGGVRACEDISATVERGEVFAIIGPNGAGKSSLINVISGAYKPKSGSSVKLTDRDGRARELVGLRSDRIAHLGLVRTIQNLGVFGDMTVQDNLLLGRYIKQHTGVFASGFRLPRVTREEVAQLGIVEDIASRLGLAELLAARAGELPYGLQKRVELGRALAMEPTVLLLDEPMAGMSQNEKRDIVEIIGTARADTGMTIVLVEHDIGVVMRLADHVLVLDAGRTIASGTPNQVRSDPEVIAAYLGTEASEDENSAQD